MPRSSQWQHSDFVLKVFCFLQYNEVISSEELYIDPVHRFLNCIQPKKDRPPEGLEKFSAAKEYGLVLCDCIRGRRHVVLYRRIREPTFCQKGVSENRGFWGFRRRILDIGAVQFEGILPSIWKCIPCPPLVQKEVEKNLWFS